jgi:hypothetical protein
MTRIAGALVALLCATASARADGSSAGYEYGGQFTRFDPVVRQYNQSGEQFRIVGHCQSSCTLFLSIRNVCIEQSATLLFHAGGRGTVNQAATNHLLNAYNAKLRHYLVSNGYMSTLEFHTIPGPDMIRRFGYRACRRA